MPYKSSNLLHCGRRAFLKGGTLLLTGVALSSRNSTRLLAAAAEDAKPLLRVGLTTDLHHANKDAVDVRYYRESLRKFAEAAKRFAEDKVDFVITLGDSIDSAASLDDEQAYLKQVVDHFSRIPCKSHFVVGNHCVSRLNKGEFLEIVGQERTYYSFDAANYHFVLLDACFRHDGAPYGRGNFDWTDSNIPPAELTWLRDDLRQTQHPCIVCIHQCLDVDRPLGVKNAAEVRKVLEDSGKVLAVLQGHRHEGCYQELGGLHYCTLKAMIEGSDPKNNAYALFDILPDHAMRISGFKNQKSYRWP